ncbi:DUF402 domain-containing protein [Paenibacillus sp. HJGM_3]|uniref:DUF402 domain-containing protein n=1 Tax=Paenibacillus sp. HJGM_3 TaxID=3379816 RepID=UPI0038598262
MIRKYADRADWMRILERRFHVYAKHSIGFSGHIALLEMIRVKGPLHVTYDQSPICIVDNGYKWLQHFPEHASYVLTSVYNDKAELVQSYIDICKQHGITDQGVPWYDDLYLDVVMLPTGEVFLLDKEELEEAYQQGIVSEEDYKHAWFTAKLVLEECRNGSFDLALMADKHLQGWLEEE